MKLSYSTNGWQNYEWSDFVKFAVSNKFSGIEIHDILSDRFCGENGPFSKERINSTAGKLALSGLNIPCIDASNDISDADNAEKNIDEIRRIIDIAAKVKCPYVRVHAYENGGEEEAFEASKALIKDVLPFAEKNGITVLIETIGIFADTSRLRNMLNFFASDYLGALWDIHHTSRYKNEDTEVTVQNLGAYIKHVHLKDSCIEDGKVRYCLLGEGDLPVEDMFRALRSVNYEGFYSFECFPDWLEDLGAEDIVFPHYVSFMSRYDTERLDETVLYDNKAKTGKFVWEKDVLVKKTFSQVLDKMVDVFPDQIALKYTTLDYTRTYSEFRDDVDECARAFIAMGVKKGDHVAVWATNVPQWYISFWAATKIGAVLVTVNTAYKIHELEYLLRQSDTHTLVMIEKWKDSDYSGIVSLLCPELEETESGKPLHCKRLPFLRNIITVGFEKKGCISWDKAMDLHVRVPKEELLRRASQVSCHDVANMQYTSGTTGFPKGVMLTHYNIVNNGKCIGDRMDLSTADRMMIQVPMFHCFGMVLAMTAAMTHGTSLFPIPYFSPKPSLKCINAERITAFHGVPTMFIALLEHEDFKNTDFSYMRTGIMAGSPCPIAVMRDVVEKMHMTEITIVYGQTESSPGCTMSSTDDSLEVRVSTVGTPLPNIECKIVDPETGEDLPDNVTGEFVARGYNIMRGYYKMPKATASVIDKDGWLHTGDLALRTPEGYYRITGRLKDMIIRGGENIYPKEIEEFIYTHPKVSDVQVIGVPDEQYGEEILASIILKEGETMTEDEMKQYVRDNMAKHKVPRYIDFVTSFPMNVAGKILKYKMREDAIEKFNLKKASSIETA